LKARRGQIALYLVLVLVAITVLVLMNVNVFLAVRAKNHATASGDAAALAAAGVQADLLREIGEENVIRLQAALRNEYPDYDWEGRRDCNDRIRRLCFLSPLRALSVAAKAAIQAVDSNSADVESFEDQSMRKILEQHVFDVRNVYVQDTELYPEPWEGAWEEYAQELELQLGGDGLVAGPENCEFADAYEQYPLLSQGFYRAIAGRLWCWFKYNGSWIFDCDSHAMPRPVRSHAYAHFNSEIYSLHLSVKPLPEVLDAEWTNVIMRITGCSREEIAQSWMLTNGMHRFAFYDGRWNAWSSYPRIRFNPMQFPIMGPVRPEYDVLGCAALCRVRRQVPDVLAERESDDSAYSWTAAAKPFGTEHNLDGDTDVVTCLKRLVTPVDWQVRLVPVDSVGGRDLHTADAEWMEHVRDHVPRYLENGPDGLMSCWYCRQLVAWEVPGFRKEGEQWLEVNADRCEPVGGGDHCGGTAHAH